MLRHQKRLKISDFLNPKTEPKIQILTLALPVEAGFWWFRVLLRSVGFFQGMPRHPWILQPSVQKPDILVETQKSKCSRQSPFFSPFRPNGLWKFHRISMYWSPETWASSVSCLSFWSNFSAICDLPLLFWLFCAEEKCFEIHVKPREKINIKTTEIFRQIENVKILHNFVLAVSAVFYIWNSVYFFNVLIFLKTISIG